MHAVLPALLAAVTAAAPHSAGVTPRVIAFEGTMAISCFDCPPSPGTADLTVAGLVGVPVAGAEHAAYSINATPGNCPLLDNLAGTMTGVVSLSFNLVRIGAVFLVTTSGDIDGQGAGTLVVTSPVGIPCDGPATALVAGVIEGT